MFILEYYNLKKVVLLFILFLQIQNPVLSQTNLGFENWIQNQTWSDPQDWKTNNTLTFTNVFPDSNSIEGLLAAKIENNAMGFEGPGTGFIKRAFYSFSNSIDSVSFYLNIDSIHNGGYAQVNFVIFRNGQASFAINNDYQSETAGYSRINYTVPSDSINQIDSVWFVAVSKPKQLPTHSEGFCRILIDGLEFHTSTISILEQRRNQSNNYFYPNPNPKGSFFIDSEFEQINIRDCRGREIYKSKIESQELNLEFLSNGHYYLNYSIDNNWKTQKIVINK